MLLGILYLKDPVKVHHRSPSEGHDAAFRELMLHDAQKSLSHELGRLVKTAPPGQESVSGRINIQSIILYAIKTSIENKSLLLTIFTLGLISLLFISSAVSFVRVCTVELRFNLL